MTKVAAADSSTVAASSTRAPVRGPSIARASVLLTGATLIASASNYGVNVVLARWMSPAEFGDANLIVTLMLIITAVAVALQLTTARLISTADGDTGDRHRRRLVTRAWVTGAVVAALLAVTSAQLRDLTSSASALPFVVLAAGLPMYLVQAVERGVLQGRLRFDRLASTFVVEAVCRMTIAIGLVAAGFGVVGAALGLTVSFAASWLAARSATTDGSRTTASAPTPGGTAGSAGAARQVARATMILLVGQIIINNGDVVLAKALFDADVAGRYAVVALVGRAVFFCSWSVVTAAFPHAARGDVGVNRQAVRAVAAMSATLTVTVAVGAPILVPIVFGDAYRAVAPLIGPYALATSLFAVANVMATLDVAIGRARAAWVIAAGALAQTVLLLTAADSAEQMVRLQVLAMAIVVAAARAVTGRTPERRVAA